MADENLNENVVEEIDDAPIITVPIDTTLTHSGEAADAKVVGDALAHKADKSEIQRSITVDGKSADTQGNITVLASDIPANGQDITVQDEIDALKAKTGENIKINKQSSQTINEVIEDIAGRDGNDILLGDGTDTTLYEAHEEVAGAVDTLQRTVSELTGLPSQVSALQQAVTEIDGKTAEDIQMSDSDQTTVATAIAEKLGQDDIDDTLAVHGKAADAKAVGDALAETVKTVNDIEPDQDGNVELVTVENARELLSSRNNRVEDDFVVRTAGGTGSVSTGQATLVKIEGNQQHTGYVPEVLTATVNAFPRPVPAGIVGELNIATFESYVVTAGTYSLTYTDAWSADPALYGVTLVGTPISGDEIHIYWDGESDPVMTIIQEQREADPEIEVTIDKDAFRALHNASLTATLYYTTDWSEDPEDYALTIENTPVAGDSIVINYTKLDRGLITPATPSQLRATGWNLYDPLTGKTPVVRYSELYGYKIGGTYTAVAFALTEGGTQQAITPDSNGLFMVPSDGWIFVTGGDETTYLYTTWSDWINSYDGSFEAYAEDIIDLSAVMTNFPAGLLRIGDIADEIDFDTQKAISRIQRIPYTDDQYEAVKASGRDYDADTNYIYLVRANPLEYAISLETQYSVDEHGLEIMDGTTVPVTVTALYGPNLRDKLERDVLTISAQTLTSQQQAQARENIGAAADADLDSAVASINSNIAKLREGVAIIVDGDTSSVPVPVGGYAYIKNNTHGLTEGMYKNTSSSAFPVSGGIANSTVFTTVPNGTVNDAVSTLNSNISVYILGANSIKTYADSLPAGAIRHVWYGDSNPDIPSNMQGYCKIISKSLDTKMLIATALDGHVYTLYRYGTWQSTWLNIG